MNIAILGLGVVGSEVVNTLKKNKDIIFSRAGEEINPVIALVRDKNKSRNAQIQVTDNFEEILNREDIDVFVELMGGVEAPFEMIKAILKKNKAVVTANKALLAYHRYAIQDLAGELGFGYEASVAGGIPIIRALRDGLSANHIDKIIGILNGTSNFILTNMMKNGADFYETLKMAQNLGYAEANPSFDIGGQDAAHKLLILASIAYGVHSNPEDILIEGIEGISKEDIYFAKDFDYNIKLLAIAKFCNDEEIELRVHPAFIPKDKMIAKVDGVMNGVSVFGNAVGENMYYGPGAGGSATASAVISDLIDIARENNNPMLGYKKILKNSKVRILPKDKIETKYYLRLRVDDELGVLSKITKIMSECNLSVDAFLQKPRNEDEIAKKEATLFFTTHKSYEKDIQKVISILQNQEFIKQKPYMIRIED